MALSRICLDTNAYVRFRRGEREAVEAIESARSVLVPAIVVGELRTGFRLGDRAARNEAALRAFLENPAVSVLVVDEEAAGHHADLMVELRRAGTPVPTNDVWIAALALREGATVLTCDGHFRAMQGVAVRLLGG